MGGGYDDLSEIFTIVRKILEYNGMKKIRTKVNIKN